MKKGRIDSTWGGGTQCRDCGIRDLVLFADLQQNDFSLIHLPIEEIDIEAGKPLYSAGNEGDALFELAGNRYRCDIDQLECIAAADC